MLRYMNENVPSWHDAHHSHSAQSAVEPVAPMYEQPQVEPTPMQQAPSRPSGLLAGLAIGALVGALVGGATGAVVASNVDAPHVQQVVSGGSLTITNPNSTTDVNAIAAVATKSTVTIEVSSPTGSGSGSGVIYREDGYIITNAHVVTMPGSTFDQTRVRVFLNDGRILHASVVGSDPYADIAILKVDATNLVPIAVGSSKELDVGDLTVAIGAPFNLSNTVTSGVISALNRGISVGSPSLPTDEERSEDNGSDFRFNFPEAPGQQSQTSGQVTLPVIQTDADINPGNSGGPLVNSAGELIGVNVAIVSNSGQQQQAGSVGLGFAIPIDLATRIADSIIAGEKPTHGLLGIVVQDSRMDENARWRGGLVLELTRNGAAEAAGIRVGDIVTAIDGIQAVDGTSVSALIRSHAGGSEVTLDIVRNDKPMKIDVTLGTLTL